MTSTKYCVPFALPWEEKNFGGFGGGIRSWADKIGSFRNENVDVPVNAESHSVGVFVSIFKENF